MRTMVFSVVLLLSLHCGQFAVRDVQYCRGGHELQLFEVSQQNRICCDVCGDSIGSGCVTAACDACNFDVCTSCYQELPGAMNAYIYRYVIISLFAFAASVTRHLRYMLSHVGNSC
jgi:hypothetical protein